MVSILQGYAVDLLDAAQVGGGQVYTVPENLAGGPVGSMMQGCGLYAQGRRVSGRALKGFRSYRGRDGCRDLVLRNASSTSQPDSFFDPIATAASPRAHGFVDTRYRDCSTVMLDPLMSDGRPSSDWAASTWSMSCSFVTLHS